MKEQMRSQQTKKKFPFLPAENKASLTVYLANILSFSNHSSYKNNNDETKAS